MLQVGRDEVPETIKTIQRGLEADADAEELVLVTHPVGTLVEAAATFVNHGGSRALQL